jgi:hypothetical protein
MIDEHKNTNQNNNGRTMSEIETKEEKRKIVLQI